MEDGVDTRQRALEQWVAEYLGEAVSGVSASSDASFRRYFRFLHQGNSYIAMDAPPPQEDCRPFVDIAERLQGAGLLVPEILAQDLQRGFLLLQDLGADTFLELWQRQPDEAALTHCAEPLFSGAIDSLLQMQLRASVEGLPCYDAALLRRELELFPDWYLQHELGITVDGELRQRLDDCFEQLIAQLLSQSTVFVHRDYMPRNLMVAPSSPGVLDFQDAVQGPISYDIASLFKDAFISWPESRVVDWQRQYWQQALELGLPVPPAFSDFQRDIDLMGCQRHLKVIGIFARICHRDGKPRYLADVPRFFSYLNTVIARRPELAALGEILQQLDLLPTAEPLAALP